MSCGILAGCIEEKIMVTAFDVAAYILTKKGPVSHMKLQKLVYYCQAWGLVWDDKPLFGEKIEAWVNGPVVPALYMFLKGKYLITANDLLGKGNPAVLSADNRETIDKVIAFYGEKDSQWLSDLTHMEPPWQTARVGVPASARCNYEITHASMAEYYGGI
jgi:uncharacterized phage-associated protein